MTAYALLAAITAVVAFLTWRIVQRTGQWTFLVGMVVLYAWTFLGAWLFIGDAMSGYMGWRIGLSYYYLMEKMFPFELDENYLVTLFAYGVFTLLVLTAAWWMVRDSNKGVLVERPPLITDHRAFIALALIAATGSFYIIRPVILDALAAQHSIYQYTRHTEYRGSTVHSLCNEVVCLSLLIGWAIHLTSANARHFRSRDQRWAAWVYPAVVLVYLLYLMILGNRHELLMALILGTAIFLGNTTSVSWRALTVYLATCIVPMFITAKVRDLTWQEVSAPVPQVEKYIPPFKVPLIAHVPHRNKGAVAAVGERLFSNELFCAHFSLYGIRRMDIEPDPFISARYFSASMVPRLLRAQRPPTAYDHYATRAALAPGQGYTIHHAAAWYINGGWFGLAVGGLVIGLLWGSLMRLCAAPPSSSVLFRVLGIMGTGCWVAFLPLLVRDGPEAFKALIVEGFAIPIGTVVAAVLLGRKRERLAA